MTSLTIFKNDLKNVKSFNSVENILYNTYFNYYDINKFYKEHMSNELDNDNDKYNKFLFYKNDLLDCYFIFWNKNSESDIHDHSQNGCYYKVIKGDVNEYIYNKNIKLIKMQNIIENEVNYIDNNIGYHKIINNSIRAISVHVYSPPDYIMNTFY